MLSVSIETIASWERNRHTPQVHFYPKIIEYLGYCPLFDLAGNSQSKRLKQQMFVNGKTLKEFSKKTKLDIGTITRAVMAKKLNKITIEKIESVLK